MRRLWRSGAIALGLCAAGAARAECSVTADAGAVARPLNMAVQADADLIVTMAMLPKMLHIDYAAAAKRSGCDLGQVTAGDAAYELWGDDASGHQRRALPASKGAPVAMIVPVFDLLKALTSPGANKTAQTEGYLLAVISKNGDFTGVRYYTGIPGVDVLKRDMAEALAGRGGGIFRTGKDNKITLFVPAG
jgi:hypothetical protein